MAVAFHEAGVEDVLGVDGPWVDQRSSWFRASASSPPTCGSRSTGPAVRSRALPRGRPDPAAGVRRGARGQPRHARRRRRVRGRDPGAGRYRASQRAVAVLLGRAVRCPRLRRERSLPRAGLDRPRRDVVVRAEPRLLRAARSGQSIAGARTLCRRAVAARAPGSCSPRRTPGPRRSLRRDGSHASVEGRASLQ